MPFFLPSPLFQSLPSQPSRQRAQVFQGRRYANTEAFPRCGLLVILLVARGAAGEVRRGGHGSDVSSHQGNRHSYRNHLGTAWKMEPFLELSSGSSSRSQDSARSRQTGDMDRQHHQFHIQGPHVSRESVGEASESYLPR